MIPPETPIVQVIERVVVEEVDEEAGEAGPIEPEVIGEKEEEAEGSSD